MKMTGRPRSDEKAQAILQAARRCISERGYAAATIAEIAAEAGVSRGLLHYYFDSKEELLAQVVRSGTDAYLTLMGSMFGQSDSADDLARLLVTATQTILLNDPAFVSLSLECWTLARESPMVAREMQDLYRQLRDSVTKGLREAESRGIIKPAIPVEHLSALLLAMGDGLVMQILIQPELAADDRIWESLELGARSLLGTAEGTAEHTE
jgi:AcrR family transcriptional regulator